jgi:hypothetical protein
MSRDEHGIWITRLIEKGREQTVDRPVVVGLATAGLVPVVLSTVYFGLTLGETTLRFAVSHALAALVAVVGAPAIWYWERRVFTGFVTDTRSLVADGAAFDSVTERYRERFRNDYWLFTVPWAALIVGIVGINVEFFRTVGVSGYGDPVFWVYLAFAAWWGVVTGIGFFGAFVTIQCIRAVGDLELHIEPLHPDGLGGLSSIGSFAVWTTMLISLGSLTLPLAFLLAADGGYTAVVSVAVLLYVVTIAGSFLYPTVYIHHRAQRIRTEELEDRRERIRSLQREMDSAETGVGESGEMEETAKRLEIQRLRDEYNEYDAVNLYPLSVNILVRLLSSVLLPVFLILFETFVGRTL